MSVTEPHLGYHIAISWDVYVPLGCNNVSGFPFFDDLDSLEEYWSNIL